MKVLIIEDEELAAKRLQLLLDKVTNESEVIGIADSVEEAIKQLSRQPLPDLIFMDIMLADGLAFEIFNSIEVKTPVIFTTAYDEFAIRAFEVNSIDYLLKPIEPVLLERAIKKFAALRISSEKIEEVIAFLTKRDMQNRMPAHAYKSRFLVKLGDRLLPLGISDIAFFSFADKQTYLYTTAGKRYIIDYSLDELEELVDPYSFFRLNRQFLVSFPVVKTIHHYFNSKLKVFLHGIEEGVVVSRERAVMFKNWLNR